MLSVVISLSLCLYSNLDELERRRKWMRLHQFTDTILFSLCLSGSHNAASLAAYFREDFPSQIHKHKMSPENNIWGYFCIIYVNMKVMTELPTYLQQSFKVAAIFFIVLFGKWEILNSG